MEMQSRGTDSISTVSLQLNICDCVMCSDTRWAGALRWIVKRSYALGIFFTIQQVTKVRQLCYNFLWDVGSKRRFSIFILNSYAVPSISSRTQQDTQTEHRRIWGTWKGWGHEGGRTKHWGKTQPARGRWCKLWEPVWWFVCVHPWNWVRQQFPRACSILQTASAPTPTGDCCLATGKTSFHLTR